MNDSDTKSSGKNRCSREESEFHAEVRPARESVRLKIPNIYRSYGSAIGLPLNWRDEESGELPVAVKAYLDHRIDGAPFSEHQTELVRAFLDHYIGAPCWDHMNEDEELAGELAQLRSDAVTLKTADDIGAFIHRCLDLGMDPL